MKPLRIELEHVFPADAWSAFDWLTTGLQHEMLATVLESSGDDGHGQPTRVVYKMGGVRIEDVTTSTSLDPPNRFVVTLDRRQFNVGRPMEIAIVAEATLQQVGPAETLVTEAYTLAAAKRSNQIMIAVSRRGMTKALRRLTTRRAELYQQHRSVPAAKTSGDAGPELGPYVPGWDGRTGQPTSPPTRRRVRRRDPS